MEREVEVEKVVMVGIVVVISFFASNLIVDALQQVVMFIAWLTIALLLFKMFETTFPDLMRESTNTLIAGIISAVISAGIVLWLPSLILAVAKIGLMLLLIYIMLRYLAPDVLEEIKKELMSSRP